MLILARFAIELDWGRSIFGSLTYGDSICGDSGWRSLISHVWSSKALIFARQVSGKAP